MDKILNDNNIRFTPEASRLRWALAIFCSSGW